MKAVPLPFEEFQGKGVLDFSPSASSSASSLLSDSIRFQKWNTHKEQQHCYVGTEPTSVLDITRNNPSPPTSSSTTLSSSHGGSSGGAAASTEVSDLPPHSSLDERCGMGMEEWESQDQSILRLIMGDIEDPSVGLTKLLQNGGGNASEDVEFNAGGGGFSGVMDQSSVLYPISSSNFITSIDPSPPGNYSDFPFNVSKVVNPNPIFPVSPLMFHPHPQLQAMESLEEKPQILNLHHHPQFILNQNQAQFLPNPAFVMPPPYSEHPVLSPLPPAKRLNCGPFGANYQAQQQQQQQQRPQFHYPAPKQKMAATEEMASQQLQQGIIDTLFKAAETTESGASPELAQGILARLNHNLVSPIGKPFQRAAFYLKEALQQLLHSNSNNINSFTTFSPTSLLLKIGAYKSFSEISPLLQFANFTSNQALLEAVDGFDRIHIIDFDIGFGGQWASFMQELALRNGGAPSLKITAFVSSSPSSNLDEIELTFTQENLKQYASDINMPFELEILTLESLNLNPVRDCEAIVVNLPISSFSSNPSFLPLVLRFLKQLMPKIVVTMERSCDRTESPFPQLLIHALQSYAGLLESLDAVNVNLDVVQMIEKYLVQPAMEKLVVAAGRHHHHHRLHGRGGERMPPWKTMFVSCGFSPCVLSSFTESQAECLVQRSHVRGFHVEKRQSSLVLCYQRKDLISVSTWRC